MKSYLRLALLASLCVLPLQAQTAAAPPASPSATVAKPRQFLIRIIPPRPTFVEDMTAKEGEIMQIHANYWADLFKTGKVLIIGPVMAPNNPWGMAVVECASQAEAEQMAANDPSVKAGLNRYDVAPMNVFLRKKS